MICHDCGVAEGQLHQLGCDVECCPLCGIQAINCYDHCVHPADGKLRQSFVDGKRYPFIMFPNFCVRCLEAWPDMFLVPDAEWERVVPPELRKEMLCRPCYDQIKAWVDRTEVGPQGQVSRGPPAVRL